MSNRGSSQTIAVIGAGLIGRSWAALFAASGRRVHLYDSLPDPTMAMEHFWEAVRPALQELGLLRIEGKPDIRVYSGVADAVVDCSFVQECIPERLDAKHALYTELENIIAPQSIVASSSSGFKLSDLQSVWRNPDRIIIAHPFNPPHLIPLVELYGNEKTAPGVLDRAVALYEDCGKVTITLKREVLGHVANRLQAALWREAISLVTSGVASVKDVDTAIQAGPGLRWAIMGPHLLLISVAAKAGCAPIANSFATATTTGGMIWANLNSQAILLLPWWLALKRKLMRRATTSSGKNAMPSWLPC
jgi:carnitine 3-dehydrogenase